ncbi:MAG: hypothetical protein V3U60_16190 [Gammaproteobacteria bacterium]
MKNEGMHFPSDKPMVVVHHRVSGRAVIVELRGPVPGKDFEGDGCTCAPDVVVGCDIRAGCRIHDWEYRNARKMGKWAQFWFRRGVDRRLRKNVFLLMKAQGATYPERRLVSFAYFMGVRPTGWWFFRRGDLEGYRQSVRLDVGEDPRTVWKKE